MILPIIIIASISISIGISTYTFVQSFVYDVILPAIAMLFNMLTQSKYFDKFLVAREFAFMHFISELIVYIFMAIAVWIVVTAIMKISGKKMVTEEFSPVKDFSNTYTPVYEEDKAAYDDNVYEEYTFPTKKSPHMALPKFNEENGFAGFANF
jgi:large-conductance mechanosensitive channel